MKAALAALAATTWDDVPLLYRTAVAWAAAISLGDRPVGPRQLYGALKDVNPGLATKETERAGAEPRGARSRPRDGMRGIMPRGARRAERCSPF